LTLRGFVIRGFRRLLTPALGFLQSNYGRLHGIKCQQEAFQTMTQCFVCFPVAVVTNAYGIQ
jgi:hypothetical protein